MRRAVDVWCPLNINFPTVSLRKQLGCKHLSCWSRPDNLLIPQQDHIGGKRGNPGKIVATDE